MYGTQRAAGSIRGTFALPDRDPSSGSWQSQHTTELPPPPNPTPAPRRELRTSREFLEEHTVANCACLSVPLSQFQQLAYTSGPGCQTTKMKSHLVFLTGCLLEAALHWSESQVCSGYPFRAGDYSGLTDPFHGSGSLHSG